MWNPDIGIDASCRTPAAPGLIGDVDRRDETLRAQRRNAVAELRKVGVLAVRDAVHGGGALRPRVELSAASVRPTCGHAVSSLGSAALRSDAACMGSGDSGASAQQNECYTPDVAFSHISISYWLVANPRWTKRRIRYAR